MGLPQPLWIGVASGVLMMAFLGLRYGLPAYQQQLAIHEIRQRDGLVTTRHRGPGWLRDKVGDEWMEVFDDPVEVESFKARFTDTDMANLGQFTTLESVSIGQHTDVTDRGISYLGRQKKLEYLYLHTPHVTDAGLVHLEGLSNLRFLLLGRTRITASGIAKLKRALPALQVDVTR